MKKLLYILPVSLLIITGCAKKNEIKGTLPNNSNDGKTVYLLQATDLDKPFQKVDSTVIEKGTFVFDTKNTGNNKPVMAYLSITAPEGDVPAAIPFVNEEGSVNIKIDSLVTLSGTPLNDSFQKFINDMRVIDKQMSDLGVFGSNPDVDKIKALYTKQTDMISDFIKSNIKNTLGEFMLMNYAGLLSLDQVKDLVKESSPELQAKFKPLLDQAQSENTTPAGASFVGQKYINIKGNTPEGKTISLSDYVGKNKLVLVDFWASWCPPCVQEMPNVVAAYNKFKNKGFEIVGVSLDEDKESWTKALKKLNMTWPQMSDLKGWKSDLSAAYNIEAIPFTILIDQEGNIIAENLRGDELENKLAEILK